jgi:hypothetical protein
MNHGPGFSGTVWKVEWWREMLEGSAPQTPPSQTVSERLSGGERFLRGAPLKLPLFKITWNKALGGSALKLPLFRTSYRNEPGAAQGLTVGRNTLQYSERDLVNYVRTRK